MSKYRPKIQLFLPKKYKIFELWGLCLQTPVPATAGGVILQPPAFGKLGMCPTLNISGYASESNYDYVLALLISMPCFESINFYQNKLKIKLFLQNNTNFWAPPPDPRNTPFPIADFWLRVCYETYAAHTS